MTFRVVPVDSKTQDWDRKIAQKVNDLAKEFAALVNPISHAENVVRTTYSDNVSVAAKGKSLNKFGRNATVGSTFETVAVLQGTESNETFVSTNLIDSIVSSSGSDTSQTITIEGHTIDGSGNLTFVTQDAALNGQTEVTLATPLARATRAFVKNSGVFNTTPAALVGTVSIYDNTGGVSAGGVPNTASGTKLIISAGNTQSEKCATAVSQNDYWFITNFGCGVGETGAASVNYIRCRIEIRDIPNGGAWRPLGQDIVLDVAAASEIQLLFDPYYIVPKNHDVRVVARTDTNTAEVFAELQGYLALVQ